MKLKPGVRINGLRPETLLGILICQDVWEDNVDVPFVLTSVTDGTHSRASLHYLGCAFDIRTRTLANEHEKEEMGALLRDSLGADFDVVVERTHIHVEYQPKHAYGAPVTA